MTEGWERENFVCNVFFLHFRLCTLTLSRLVIHKSLENDLNSVIIAVKMQVRISLRMNKELKMCFWFLTFEETIHMTGMILAC